MTKIINYIKQKVMLSPFAINAKKLECYLQIKRLSNENSKILNNRTVHCISPYKTGTTFLSTCFNQKISQHEPMQYLSLKGLKLDFDDLFVKRLNTLDLKMECSGFWSGYIDELADNNLAKDLTYLCVLRTPSSWVTSVINYWDRSQYVKERYDFINELFWIPKTGVDMGTILSLDKAQKEASIKKLLDFYMNFTQQTKKLDNVIYIRLSELKPYIPAIGDLLGKNPI